MKVAKTKQNSPAIATVVNFGVSFLHLRVTENTEKPIGHHYVLGVNPKKDTTNMGSSGSNKCQTIGIPESRDMKRYYVSEVIPCSSRIF